MKKIFRIFILFFLFSIFNYSYCYREEILVDNYKPIIIDRESMENSVKIMPTQNIVKSGKIYIKDNFMFINDLNKGFHVYNYTNPESPIKIGFIQIFGATDLAIRDNLIYINQAVDLVTLNYNVSNNTISISHRNRNVFPQKQSPNGTIAVTAENQIVIDWTKI